MVFREIRFAFPTCREAFDSLQFPSRTTGSWSEFPERAEAFPRPPIDLVIGTAARSAGCFTLLTSPMRTTARSTEQT